MSRGLLAVRFPPTPQFWAFVAHILPSRKGGLLKAALKAQALKGSGEKRANSFSLPFVQIIRRLRVLAGKERLKAEMYGPHVGFIGSS